MWVPSFLRSAVEQNATREIRPFHRDRSYGLNEVKTSKYTWLNMLPLAVYEQFRRLSNFYFLIVAIVSFIPNVSPTSPVTTTLPLLVVVGFGLARDVYEDLMRKREDSVVNSRPVFIRLPPAGGDDESRPYMSLSDNGAIPQSEGLFQRQDLDLEKHAQLPARALSVGDVALVCSDEPFPADMLLLSVANDAPACYVSTANLDGESNLKRRTVPSNVHPAPPDAMSNVLVVAPEPTAELYSFAAKLSKGDDGPVSLSTDNLLLRGSILRNTDFVYGLVLYNGEDTKLAKNMRNPPGKLGGVERMMNRVVVGLFSILTLVTVIVSVIASVWQANDGSGQWYMGEFKDDSASETAFRSLGTFLILFHTFVPVSLFVTLEFVRLIQGMFIAADMHMTTKGVPVKSKANNLNETLGYVEHIFSDKTGTLTENVMRFVACSVDGVLYDERKDSSAVSSAVSTKGSGVEDLVRAMALSHDVVPGESRHESNDDAMAEGQYAGHRCSFQGESPDEVALVEAAFNSGFELRNRTLNAYELKEPGIGALRSYEILAKLEFTSERKRMSTVVRRPDGMIQIFTKGADMVMINLLHGTTVYAEVERATDIFSKEGLRTLVYGSRIIPQKEYNDWKVLYADASTAIDDRAAKEAEVAALIEKDLALLGVTAVEDKLQDNVPSTIKFLREAGIRLWVLTGDKRETAENIGYSSQLLDANMDVVHIKCDSPAELEERLCEILEDEQAIPQTPDMSPGVSGGDDLEKIESRPAKGHHRRHSSTGGNMLASLTLRSIPRIEEHEMGLVIDGMSLSHVKGEELEQLFLDVAGRCKTVICARVTPLQKASVVQLVRRYEHSNTLAIGDGGNDVSMIQVAHIGVGIKGKEGTQAARAADYSMAEFQHLRRLLAVHGRFSYIRTSGVINLSFYKNIFFSSTQIFFQFFCFASGTTLHNQWIVTAWNSILTLIPPFFYGIFERDLEESTVLRFPSVYKSNSNNRLFSMRTVLEFTIAYSVWHAIILFFMSYFFFGRTQPIVFRSGQDGGFYLTGLAVSTMAVPIALFKFLLTSHLWTRAVLIGILLSYALLWALIPVFVHLAHEVDLEGVLSMLMSSPTYHLLWPIVFVTAFIPDFLVLSRRMTRKSNVVAQLQLLESREALRRYNPFSRGSNND